MKIRNRPPREIGERVDTISGRLGIGRRLYRRKPKQLSEGQKQLVGIGRAITIKPEILLMDEPASALDPVSTARIEDLLFELRRRYTIVIVTHNMQQASRVSDYTAFLDAGKLIEFGETDQVFTRPKEKRTEDYVSGRFG